MLAGLVIIVYSCVCHSITVILYFLFRNTLCSWIDK